LAASSRRRLLLAPEHVLAAFMLGMHGAVWDTGVATA
jgi:hypothetical protein